MRERNEMLGERSELKLTLQRLTVECEALRDKARSLLPLHVDVLELDADAHLAVAIALSHSHKELKGIQRQIDILSRNLGGE